MFDFQPRQARVRRAWERLPTSPLAPGRKGRKVWKRPQPTSAIESSEVTSLRNEAAGNRGHSIKRLRTTRVSTVPARGAGRRNQQFVAMLQDQAPGTPKRKTARRRTLRGVTIQGPAARKSLRNSTSPSKRRRSLRLSLAAAAEPRNIIPGSTLPDPTAIPAAAMVAAPRDEWEDVPASRQGSPDLTAPPERQASSEVAGGAGIEELGAAIEIINQAGAATAMLLAAASADETARKNSEGLTDATLDATPQESLEPQTQPGHEVFETTSESACFDEHQEENLDDQEHDDGSQASVSLHNNNEPEEASRVPALAEDHNNPFEQVETKADENMQVPTLDDAGKRSSLRRSDVQIDSTNLEEAASIGTSSGPANETEANGSATKRPIPRLSDDTNMLRAFVSRAQAKKAAEALAQHKAANSSPVKLHAPRRSPRKILGNLDRNSPSPVKPQPQDMKQRQQQPPQRQQLEPLENPGTPRSKAKLVLAQPEDEEDDEGDEIALAPASQRRSARKRTSARQKPSTSHGTTGPSLIPLRSLHGSEPLKIQRSAAQELALVTRANTRRNKGPAKLPRAILEALTADVTEASAVKPLSSPVKKRAPRRQAKAVDWDETLVYFPDADRDQLTSDDKPRIRRIKGLSSANGTPMGKKAGRSVPGETSRPSTPRRACRDRG